MKAGRDFIGVAVGALIENEEGKLLVGRRGKKASDDHYQWDFPGGKVDFLEMCKEAAIREIKEEFGIDIEIVRLNNFVEVITESTHFTGPSYVCKLVSGEPKIMEEDKFTEFGWFTPEEVEALELTDPGRQNINMYLKKIKEY